MSSLKISSCRVSHNIIVAVKIKLTFGLTCNEHATVIAFSFHARLSHVS